MLTKEELIAFEEDICNEFNQGKIRAPVHLNNGNEEEIIKVFKDNNIGKNDWCFGTWRTHYICLLKGVPKEQLKQDILVGKSITLCYPEYNIFSSAIVTGSIPIAVGTALGLKLQNKPGKVYCFVGDMGSETGSFWENFKYATANKLPIKFIIEDNNKSVCTDTRKTWNIKRLTFEELGYEFMKEYIYYYKYSSKYPHAGGGVRLSF